MRPPMQRHHHHHRRHHGHLPPPPRIFWGMAHHLTTPPPPVCMSPFVSSSSPEKSTYPPESSHHHPVQSKRFRRMLLRHSQELKKQHCRRFSEPCADLVSSDGDREETEGVTLVIDSSEGEETSAAGEEEPERIIGRRARRSMDQIRSRSRSRSRSQSRTRSRRWIGRHGLSAGEMPKMGKPMAVKDVATAQTIWSLHVNVLPFKKNEITVEVVEESHELVIDGKTDQQEMTRKFRLPDSLKKSMLTIFYHRGWMTLDAVLPATDQQQEQSTVDDNNHGFVIIQ